MAHQGYMLIIRCSTLFFFQKMPVPQCAEIFHFGITLPIECVGMGEC